MIPAGISISIGTKPVLPGLPVTDENLDEDMLHGNGKSFLCGYFHINSQF
jgi:hypothetical protein